MEVLDGLDGGYNEVEGRGTFFGGGPEVDGFGKVIHLGCWWRR